MSDNGIKSLVAGFTISALLMATTIIVAWAGGPLAVFAFALFVVIGLLASWIWHEEVAE